MKDIVVRTGTSILAAAIGYIVLTVMSDGLSVQLKVLIAAGLAILAFVASIWASSEHDTNPERKMDVASDLKGKSATVEDVTVYTAEQTARIASNIEASDSIKITGVKVNPSMPKPE
jgi:membrane protein implicated in regulation of membrane protease activity